jgi:hypothetical protein
MTTRFIITSDLHQRIGKWRDLVRAVEQERPRFVLMIRQWDSGSKEAYTVSPLLMNWWSRNAKAGKPVSGFLCW